MYLNVPFILKSLSHEASWKAGDSVSFSFEDWNLNLKRDEEKYKPFTFHLTGKKENSNETWSRRYVRMELAYLHILNHFNENAVITNPYKSLADIIERFPDKGLGSSPFSVGASMDLKQFLSFFDFDYDIVPPGGKYEDRIRQELIEDKKLTVEEAGKDLICLIDCQGAYLGDIGKERFPICPESVNKIVDRMNTYINEFEVEFHEALEERGVDPSDLSLEEMIIECKAFGVGDGEVCYSLAEAVNTPESIYIKEVLEHEKDNIVLDFGNIVSELESKKLKLLKLKDNNSLFVVDSDSNLYCIEPYYAGGYLDRFIGEKYVISFDRIERSISDFEDWRKQFMDAPYIKDFIERIVKKEYPDFTETSLTGQFHSDKGHNKHLNQELVRMTKNNKPDEMIRLIREGADVNYKDKFGVPVLLWATNHAHSHTIELLVENGADVNAQDKGGKTKLMLTASYGDMDVVSYLLEHGANAGLKDREGRDALSFAKESLSYMVDRSEGERDSYKKVISLLEKALLNQNKKMSLSNQIEAASNRSADVHSPDNALVKVSSPQR